MNLCWPTLLLSQRHPSQHQPSLLWLSQHQFFPVVASSPPPILASTFLATAFLALAFSASALSAVAFLAVAFTATAFLKVNFLGSQFLNSIFFHSSCTSTTVSFLAVASTAATVRFCSLARLNGTINYQRDPYAGLLEP